MTSRDPLGVDSPRGSDALAAYWADDATSVLRATGSSPDGLTATEAATRLASDGRNELTRNEGPSRLVALWNQVRNPLLWILLVAATISSFTGEFVDALIVLVIVVASVGIGYSREYKAAKSIALLRARVSTTTLTQRDGRTLAIPTAEVVRGDIVLLSAGSLVPADAYVLDATDCFVNEAVLTGESYPAEKKVGIVSPASPLSKRSNCVFFGTNVRSGTARCVVTRRGQETELGAIAHRLLSRAPETEFDRGLRNFGYLLTVTMLVMVLLVFAINVFLGRSTIETLLFSVALAVGLSPELLPVILSVNLARGAERMATRGVLVRKLSAIENLGSMDVLCTDKTGTLTEGVVRLDGAYDGNGDFAADVLELGAVNAGLQAGLKNPLDDAILSEHPFDPARAEKIGEVPYDFTRKRLSVAAKITATGETPRIVLVTKGAFPSVLEICTTIRGGAVLGPLERTRLESLYADWGRQGVRVLGVASRSLVSTDGNAAAISRESERDLEFVGFLAFRDRPKEGAAEAVKGLVALGVGVKLITGDSKLVAQYVAGIVGLDPEKVLTGAELDALPGIALLRTVVATDLFVEVDPSQKERIIVALRRAGRVVGFLGDGVNDAPAMHAADTSLSVEGAVDVAKEAADFVLLERRLDVIRHGIEEGRRTFANTLKYVLTTMSANLGNMVSMALASLFLPFLPLLAGQILLNNFLSDVPAFGLADDAVDPELVDRPRRWNGGFVGRYMLVFGLLSSVFDVLTFGALLFLFGASQSTFRTGWFLESLLTELAVALVVRTRRRCYESRPGRMLAWSSAIVAVLAVLIPYLPHANDLGFTPLPPLLLATLILITLAYIAATELVKPWFFRRFDGPRANPSREDDERVARGQEDRSLRNRENSRIHDE